MNKKMPVCAIALCVCALIMSACSKTADPILSQLRPEVPVPVQMHHIPFASQAELDVWQGDPNVVYYRTARMLAMLELEYGSSAFSERPVVLYDFDATPRYYEFVITDGDGKPYATVCTYARKDQPAVLAFMLPYIRDYAPQVKSMGLQTYALRYPTQLYYGLPTRSGSTPVLLMNDNHWERPEVPPVQHQLDHMAQIDAMDADYFAALGIDDFPAQRAAIAEALQAEQQAANMYWELVALIEDDLIALEKKGWVQTKATTVRVDEFVLEQYDTEAMQKTRWTGGCGPSALANMYRGLYDSYKGMYLPIYGDENFMEEGVDGRFYWDDRAVYFYKDMNDDDGDGIANIVDRKWIEARSALTDNGLYADICDNWWHYFAYRIPLVPTWGAALPINLTHSLERVSNNEYTISILPICFSHHHIRTRKLSVILLNSGFSHYLHAYGSRERYWKWDTIFKLFGKEVRMGTPEIVTHRWFKINDSGTDMEKHNMLPFWMADCITNSIFHFGVYKRK